MLLDESMPSEVNAIEDSRLDEILNAINLDSSDWKDCLKRRLCEVVVEKQGRRERKTTFSLGDSDELNDTSSTEGVTSIGVQTEDDRVVEVKPTMERKIEELEADWKAGRSLLPGDVLRLLNRGKAKSRDLESRLGDLNTAVSIRRSFVSPQDKLANLPFTNFDYKYVTNSCCENVIGYVPVPVGVAGPLKVNGGSPVYIPMATTEGALVASTNRGCSALMKAGGVSSTVYSEGMTRAPVVQFESSSQAVKLKKWIEGSENFDKLKAAFDSTSRFARLEKVDVLIDGRLAHIRFVAKTGDAMGMNMVSKASSMALNLLSSHFPSMKVIALSGNICTDKKSASINWISGRGRSVVADAVLPSSVVSSVLKTTTSALVQTARAKLESGSALAASVGGGNAQAANIVAAIFIATGQDAAQVVSSSMCSTQLEEMEDGALYAAVTLPCVEVGTVGGGTILPAQSACLKLLGVAGPSPPSCATGTNASSLAEIIAATVLAGELSLMAALTTDDLVSSHLKLNRSRLQLYASPSTSLVSTEAAASLPQPVVRGKSTEKLHVKVDCSSIL